MQSEGKLVPEMVIIQYGHATHASFEDLEKIKKLGVIFEANLTSNKTTGSMLTITSIFLKVFMS